MIFLAPKKSGRVVVKEIYFLGTVFTWIYQFLFYLNTVPLTI
jgi:hypothetical protein